MSKPPGKEIYKDGRLSFFEIDGSKKRVWRVIVRERHRRTNANLQSYCQNLCLLGKMYIESKTAYLNVDEFTFYVLCEAQTTTRRRQGAHVIDHNVLGYFSKASLYYRHLLTARFPSGERVGDELQPELHHDVALLPGQTRRPADDRLQFVSSLFFTTTHFLQAIYCRVYRER